MYVPVANEGSCLNVGFADPVCEVVTVWFIIAGGPFTWLKALRKVRPAAGIGVSEALMGELKSPPVTSPSTWF